ncbi:transcriptional regulator, AlpA family [Nitratireductor indicus]|nr:transcriptional regulator, AlpA family [Nitratireductor indicus]
MTQRQQKQANEATYRSQQDPLLVLSHFETRRIRRTIRRAQLREIIPLSDTTIYEMEQRGEFPKRFYLTSRCVVWDLAEVEAWIDERRRASEAAVFQKTPSPDVRKRKKRPVRI